MTRASAARGGYGFEARAATSGYYRNPAATLELMREPGWLDSGDLAYLADGELYITGRAKDLIIKAGRNLYPHEIEDVAGRVAGVRTGCVVAFGAPDARSGTERLVVAAEVRNPAEAKRISAEITRAVDEAMGMPPDLIEMVPPHSIPKTSSGKLRRSETRRLFLEGKLGKKVAPPWVQIAKLAVRTAAPRAWALVKRGAKAAIEFSVRHLCADRFCRCVHSALAGRRGHQRSKAGGAVDARGDPRNAFCRRNSGSSSGKRTTGRSGRVRSVDLRAEPLELRGHSSDGGILAAGCAVRSEG